MTSTNLTIKDLFTGNEKLTFLIGAGCSIDPPSHLPPGRKMIEAIINYTCAESEQQKILELEEPRFEQLVEIVRDQLDPELKIIDYYSQCETPNPQHFFLAEMIKKGQFVMTTNFDFLIEYALLQSNVPKDDIITVITRDDFEEFNDPVKLFEKGKKMVYKIHGSIKNVISEESTRDSLVATIQAFGSGKEGENVFQVEPFKRSLFNNISNNRTLVVMGYSGSNDFDIIPTLMVLNNLKNIVWINYMFDDSGVEKIYEIDDSTVQEAKKLDKVTQILVDIYRMQNADHVYRVDANTTRLIKYLFNIKESLDLERFSVSPITWLRNNVNSPDEFIELFIPYKIYRSFDMYKEAMMCSEKLLLLSDKKKDLGWKAISLNNIAIIHHAHGNYPEALKRYEEALKIAEQLGSLSEKAKILNNIGLIHYTEWNYPEALKQYEEALRIAEQLGSLSEKAKILNNIGLIHYTEWNYPEALKQYEETLRISEQLGDLSGKATSLNNIGEIFRVQGNYPEALKRCEEAMNIAEQLGDLSEKTISLNLIGLIYDAQGNYPEALKQYEEALRIAEQLGDLSGKATFLNNIGEIFRVQGNYPEALKRYEEALRIAEQLGDLSGKATFLNNIGEIFRVQGNYPEALKRCEEAMRTVEQLGDLSGKAISLNNIGLIHYAQGNYPEALKRYDEALRIAEHLGDLSGKATSLNNISEIFRVQGNYPEALKRYEEALIIDKNNGPFIPESSLKGYIRTLGQKAKEKEDEKIEKVIFTAAYPGCLRPKKWYSFLIYLHVPGIQKEIQEVLDRKKFKLGFHPTISIHDYGIKLTRGTVFKFTPRADNLTFNPDFQTIAWFEDYHEIEFRIKTLFDIDKNAEVIESGFVDISVGGILIAQIPFSLKIGLIEDDNEKSMSIANIFSKIFISYAHKDQKLVDRVIACYKALGIEILMDRIKLESGHPWKEDLQNMIDNADIFQLFWSYASKESKNVEKEWRYALSLEGLKSEYFIRPFYWEKPMPPPPDELKHLHFATLDLDSITM